MKNKDLVGKEIAGFVEVHHKADHNYPSCRALTKIIFTDGSVLEFLVAEREYEMHVIGHVYKLNQP
jgi:hypothetical protein